jgi:5S rRNA maturation endonuclease (ribonuclease M5)
LPISEEILEEIDEILERLKEAASNDIPILVEGEKDIKALKKLDIDGNFQKISGGGTLLNLLESLSGFQEVVVLTDFDKTGKKLANFCAKHLRRIGVNPNTEFWEKLGKLMRKDVKDIEGLARFILTRRAALRGLSPART